MNTADLLTMRRAGKRPDGPVLATLVPEVNRYHLAVTVGRTDDLAGFHGLDVFLAFATPQIESAIHIADKLIRARVESVVMWALDTGQLVNVMSHGETEIHPTLPTPTMARLVKEIRCK